MNFKLFDILFKHIKIIKRCNIFQMLIIYEIILDFLLILHKLSINISPHKLSSVSRDITYIMQKSEFKKIQALSRPPP
jgi:hypothetical protein